MKESLPLLIHNSKAMPLELKAWLLNWGHSEKCENTHILFVALDLHVDICEDEASIHVC
jgi:hypothetical protein